jgi:hypothetical protein
MKLLPLLQDLEALAAQHLGVWPLVQQLRETPPQFAALAPLLGEFGAQTGIGRYRSLALLLKADWLLHTHAPRDWRPWEHAASLRRHLGDTAAAPAADDLDAMLLEQCALSCHVLDQAQVAGLAERHAHESALLAQGTPGQRQAFVDDKCAWLHEELQLDVLLGLRQDLVAELEQTRLQYLSITGRAAVEMIEAAHRLALMRYRLALNDPTLTAEELNLRLIQDLGADAADAALVHLEPELRLALLDTVQSVRGDHLALLAMHEVWASGNAQLASDEDRSQAALLFRRLARLIHPDALRQREGYADIAPQNQQRLEEIWHRASATHGARVHLSRDKLINYLQNLQAWIVEVERILRAMSFHAPSRLLEGDTLQGRHDDLRRARLDVQRHQHAVRDDIARLEFDPLHSEYRRIIALEPQQREQECERMQACTLRWNDEARRLAVELAARMAGSARDDAAQVRGEKKDNKS